LPPARIQQLGAARVAEGLGVKLGELGPPAQILDELPDSVGGLDLLFSGRVATLAEF